MAEGSRDYKKEYEEYHSTPKQRARRAARNRARRYLEKKGRVHKGDGKDIDHKDRNPRNNSDANLRVQSKHVNRGNNK